MEPTWIVLMVVAAAGMLYGRKKQRAGVVWGKPLTVLCGILVIGFAVTNLFTGGSPGRGQMVDISRAYKGVAAEKMGSYLASRDDVSTVLLIVEPGKEDDATTQKQIEGLRKGLGGDVELVDTVSPHIPAEKVEEFKEDFSEPMGPDPSGAPEGEGEGQPEFSMSQVPREMWFDADSMDTVIQEYSDRVDVVVSALGLPQDVGDMETFQSENGPRIALLEGGIFRYKKAIEQGVIVAAVRMKPDLKLDQPRMPPRDLEKAFSRRYILVTPENVDELASKYSSLFAE